MPHKLYPRGRCTIDSLSLARCVARAVIEKKGEHVTILNIGHLSSFADYFIIATAQSDRQAGALANHITDTIKELGLRPIGTEGQNSSQWVLVDYGDVVAHIFREEARLHYDLDGLWREAPRVNTTEERSAASQ